jgi:hypothetical protein
MRFVDQFADLPAQRAGKRHSANPSALCRARLPAVAILRRIIWGIPDAALRGTTLAAQ